MSSIHPTVYLVGPAAESAAIDRATVALEAAGYVVDTATIPPTDANAEELAEIAAYDLDAALDAAAIVALPGSDDLFEVITARVIGLPVVSLADALAPSRPARRGLVSYAGPARGLSVYLRSLASAPAAVMAGGVR